ncbi:MAG: ABC transporter ATP-binding protein [Bacillota bacterium]|nr:ABC transporter ATP-binding protein [Bacillota bacterium]NLU55354.1 ABC transporter ATP-binding protein [Bacillota bacterium]HOJ46300.1 ABC transporter ATP-binding protein [Bacillota bacterium]
MAEVVLKNVTKQYPNGVVAVDNINLTIDDEQFLVLVGPSGCGKTTTLRMIAGLEEITQGEIMIDGKVVNKIPPDERDIAIVFQDYVLYPHKTVYENMAFGLENSGLREVEAQRAIEEAASILGLSGLLDRFPGELSGGQKQRVALGRAIVRQPKVLLMDEPLSNLDPVLRSEMRAHIKRMQRKRKITTVYVTHDQQEAMTMGDKIVLMHNGVIQQEGPARELYLKPRNKYVATFLGNPSMNIFDAKLVKEGDKVYAVADSLKVKLLPEHASQAGVQERIGKEVFLGLRPESLEDVEFVTEIDVDPANIVTVTVDLLEAVGASAYVTWYVGNNKFVAEVDAHSSARVGQEVKLYADPRGVQLFDKVTEESILVRD